MPLRIVQPTKEQVRAYMAAREAQRRPPPPPDEIRRVLGWRIEQSDPDIQFLKFYLIPTNYSHLATSLLIEWLSAWSASAPSSFLPNTFTDTRSTIRQV